MANYVLEPTNGSAEPPLDILDVVVVGVGITGPRTAFVLCNVGLTCLLAEAKNIGFGTTGRSWAHVSTILELSYDRIIAKFGEVVAKLVARGWREACYRAPTYIIAHVSVGIGFLGAGLIFRDASSQTAHGLTTAASVWCTAAVGVAVGVGMFVIAVVAAVALYLLLSMERWRWYLAWKERVRIKRKDLPHNDR